MSAGESATSRTRSIGSVYSSRTGTADRERRRHLATLWERQSKHKSNQRKPRQTTMATRVKQEKQLPAQLFVQRQFQRVVDGQKEITDEDGESEILAVRKFETDAAKVQVEYGLTINLGNYEAARLGVAVTVPCYMEELDDAYKWACKWAEERIMREQDQIRKSVKERQEDLF